MKWRSAPSLQKGFTLIEIMVVVSIIVLLLAVIGVSSLQSNQKSRDAKRQADIRLLESAIELYKNKHGRYPVACTPANAGTAQGWSGQQGTNYACAGSSNEYIIGLAPEFITALPYERKLNGVNSGYVYRTNANGTVYKIKAHRTVEADVIDFNHEFKACDIRVASDPTTGNLLDGSTNREVIGWCGRVHPTNSLPSQCRSTNAEWRNSYAAWGGFEPKRSGTDTNNGNAAIVQDTTAVICQ